jgi:hypothetical protein
LHGDELVPSVVLRSVLECPELPASHRACTDVPHLALFNDVVERLHDLFSRCVAIQTVDLQYIDICAQSLHAFLDRVKDVLVAQPDLVDHVAVIRGHRCDAEAGVFFVDAEIAIQEEDDLVSWDVVLL